MIKIKALTSFCGQCNMRIGETKDVQNTEVIRDLITCGYVEVVGGDIDDIDDTDDLKKMTKSDLIAYAAARGIIVDEKSKKDDIIATIESGGAEEGDTPKSEDEESSAGAEEGGTKDESKRADSDGAGEVPQD